MALKHHFTNEDDPIELQIADDFCMRYLPNGATDEEHRLLMVVMEAFRKDSVRRLAGEHPDQRLRLVC
jgi:hypothetical protein